jgi:hypothetical protein
MKSFSSLMARSTRVLLSLMLVASYVMMFGPAAYASTTDSIYSYALDGSSSTVSNNAASNSGADLSLVGDWSQTSFGVHFAGDTVSQQSGGSYKPSTGNTISVPTTDAVGAGIDILYQAPASGSCFSDSSNLTQIGRFAANTGQIKLQYSNCGNDSSHVYPECRMAGASTPVTVLPVRSTQALVGGNEYIIKCYKTTDPSMGNATITLRVVKVDTINGNTVTNDTFSVSPTGAITSNAYLSVANKFALPIQANNTDQFVGDVAKASYCQASSVTAVSTCLDAEEPEPVVTPNPVMGISVSGPSTLQVGQNGTFVTNVSNSSTGSSAAGTSVVVTVPANMTIVSASGATISGQTATWSIGSLTGGTNVNETVVATLNSGTVGSTFNVSAATSTTDGSCGNTGSVCSNSYTTTVASSLVEYVTNNGVETNLTGWTGSYGTGSLVSVSRNTSGSHTGSADVKVLALSGASNSAVGFSDSPRWVTNTVASKTYTASVWVKPSFVGQTIVLRNRELNGSTIVTDTKYTLTAANTNWQQITNTITPVGNGRSLSFAVYGGNMNAGDSFEVDDLSLTSL